MLYKRELTAAFNISQNMSHAGMVVHAVWNVPYPNTNFDSVNLMSPFHQRIKLRLVPLPLILESLCKKKHNGWGNGIGIQFCDYSKEVSDVLR